MVGSVFTDGFNVVVFMLAMSGSAHSLANALFFGSPCVSVIPAAAWNSGNTAICAACQAAGFTPRFRHHVEKLTALLALAAAGKGVTLAPAEVGQLPHPQAVFVPLTPPVPSVIFQANS